MSAYWISPKGEIINVKTNHISTVINNPKKFGFNKEFIETIHDVYGEKIGTEGKAREQLILALFKEGWIRIRKYKKFYTVNVKRLDRRAKSYLSQWAKKILKGLFGFKEQDKFTTINIDQENRPIRISDLHNIAASDKFLPEHILFETTIEDMDDVESIIDETKKLMKRLLFSEYLKETSLNRIRNHMIEHDSGTITAFRDEYNKGQNKARNKVLLAKLMSQYSVTKAKGSYIENYNTPKAKKVGENIFIVVDIKDKGNLKNTLMKLGEEFEQDSILFIPKGGRKGFLIGTNRIGYPGYHIRKVLKNPIFGKTGEMFTRVNGRPFILKEDVSEVPIPGCNSGRWAMSLLSRTDWREFYNENK